jgi:hypothetical protein
MTAKLWASHAATPYGNDYGQIAVVAATREEAIAKARLMLSSQKHSYVPDQRYADALLDNLDSMYEVTDGVVVDWDSQQPTRRYGRR